VGETYEKLQVDRVSPVVARVLINRPDKRNAIDFDVRQQLTEVFEQLLQDTQVRAVIIGGVGGNFSAGGDLPSMANLSDSDAHKRMQHIGRLCRLIHGAGIPIVTAMEGISAGACIGLALLGDWIVAGANTKVLLPFMKLGLIPDWGMLHTLPLRVGLPAARRLFGADRPLNVNDALHIGLFDDLVPDADVMPTAICEAERLAALPREAFALMKSRLAAPSSSLDRDLAREENDQAHLLLSSDFQEGYAAFMEKRRPDFLRSGSKAQ
jgi:2-(1,2-epoxy-1,2-dihydrophenyl)acetyl-CoA isomerase